MKRALRLIIVVLSVTLFSGTALAAPDGAIRAAEKGLADFKVSEKGRAGYWGLTEEELESLTVTGGYQMVGFNGPKEAPATERVSPFGRDHYLFYLSTGNKNVIAMRVVDMPDGWQAVSYRTVGGESGSSLSKAQSLLSGQKLSETANPRVFLFRGDEFWLLDVDGQSFIYPVAGTRVSPQLQSLGVSGDTLAPAKDVLEKLASLPVPAEDDTGGGTGIGPSNSSWQDLAVILLPLAGASAVATMLVRRLRHQ